MTSPAAPPPMTATFFIACRFVVDFRVLVIVLVVVLENCITLWSLDVSVISLGLMVVVVVVVRKAEVGVVAVVVVLMVVSSSSSIANVVGTSWCKTK